MVGVTIVLDQPIIKDRIDALLREVMGDRVARNRLRFSPATVTVLCDRDDCDAVALLDVIKHRVRMPSIST